MIMVMTILLLNLTTTYCAIISILLRLIYTRVLFIITTKSYKDYTVGCTAFFRLIICYHGRQVGGHYLRWTIDLITSVNYIDDSHNPQLLITTSG
jgi:hypothetical protein